MEYSLQRVFPKKYGASYKIGVSPSSIISLVILVEISIKLVEDISCMQQLLLSHELVVFFMLKRRAQCIFHQIHTYIYIFNKIFTEHKLAHLRGLLGVKDTVS
jgi:hypothetical protein